MSPAVMLSVENVNKYFGNTHVVKDLTFNIGLGEFVSLLGPSGCGKTTMLRMIAGLEEVSSGNIHLGDVDITFVPPYKRNAGMVFQSYALFPHMNVEQNISFGLEMRKIPKKEIPDKIQKALQLIKLEGYEKRLPKELSGGQQQRVALARALAIEPAILLLDEPLSNLDARLREEMRVEIKRIQNETGITTIFVTHDQEEALTLSDRVIIMREGKILEEGSPIDIYMNPKCEFSGSFMGHTNILQGKITGVQDDIFIVKTDQDLLFYASKRPGIQPDDRVTVILRHEHVFVVPETDPRDDTMSAVSAKVQMVTFLGPAIEYICKANGVELRARVPIGGNRMNDIEVGQEVLLQWAPENSIVLRRQ